VPAVCVLQVIHSPDRRILLNASVEEERRNEIVDIHYLDSGGTNNMSFSFLSRTSIPIPWAQETLPLPRTPPDLAFSADGSKFAMATVCGRVSVWDTRSKVPLKTFMEVPISDNDHLRVQYLQFSSGNLGKEALVFIEVRLIFTF
jgi:hypothetical protein